MYLTYLKSIDSRIEILGIFSSEFEAVNQLRNWFRETQLVKLTNVFDGYDTPEEISVAIWNFDNSKDTSSLRQLNEEIIEIQDSFVKFVTDNNLQDTILGSNYQVGIHWGFLEPEIIHSDKSRVNIFF